MRARERIAAAAFLVLVAALAAGAARRVAHLRIRVNDLDLLPTKSEVLRADGAIRDTFGSALDERMLVAFTSRRREVTDPSFRADFRLFVSELAKTYNLRLLLFDRLYHPRFTAAGRSGEPWLLHPPDGAWIDRALRATKLAGTLAAGRSRRTVFLEAPAFSPSGVRDVEARVRRALATVEAVRPGEYEVRLIGRQVVLNRLGDAIFADLSRLLPWAFLVIFALFWALYRSWLMASLALLQSGLCVLYTMAILDLLGHPISLTTAMVPVLLTVLGIADDLHLHGEYLRLRQLFPDRPPLALAWEGVRRVFFPCTATGLTTAIGFASFLPTDVPALRIFGLVAGIGVILSWILTLTLVPLLLAFIPLRTIPEWTFRPRLPAVPSPFRRALPWALSLALIPGVLRLRIDDGWTRNFAPDHPAVADVQWFERESVGVYQFDVLLRRTDGRSWTDPELLRSLVDCQRRIERAKGVTASLSLADLVRDRAWELGPPAAPRPPLPPSRAAVERTLATYRLFNEATLARLFLDASGGSTRLLFTQASDDYVTSSGVRREIDRQLAAVFPAGVAARVGGSAERGRVLIDSVVSSQGLSVVASLALSWLTLGFASRRWGTTGRCILAISWALLLVLGVAGWAGIPLGVASSCFLALGVGVGLDYGIHLGFGEAEGEEGPVFLRVVANVVTVGLGLSVLMLSGNPTIARLGLLIVLSMAAAGYTACVVFVPRPAASADGVREDEALALDGGEAA